MEIESYHDRVDHNRPEYTVSEFSSLLKDTVESAFPSIRIRGEVSRLVTASSGHMYLTLKDDNAVIDGVCWKGTVSRLGVRPEEGLEIIASGRVSTYSGRSSYQIIIEQVEVAGEGASGTTGFSTAHGGTRSWRCRRRRQCGSLEHACLECIAGSRRRSS